MHEVQLVGHSSVTGAWSSNVDQGQKLGQGVVAAVESVRDMEMCPGEGQK